MILKCEQSGRGCQFTVDKAVLVSCSHVGNSVLFAEVFVLVSFDTFLSAFYNPLPTIDPSVDILL